MPEVALGDSSSPMVLCPVNCHVEVRFTTIFALRNGKIFRVRGWLTPHTPLSFVPVCVGHHGYSASAVEF